MTTDSHIAASRLHNQRLTGPKFHSAADVVRWFGAMQAQDYAGSLWAMGLRMQGATQKVIEQAIAARKIVRTWPMRGTLHFVAAEDVRWILQLLTPRVIARSRSRHRQLGLDEGVFARSRNVFVKALSGRQISRPELYKILEKQGIGTHDARGLHILGQLAQEGLICFATHDGKQPTFALLEEWVPSAKNKERDEALAELARRYFTSHGPATQQDFCWWAGITTADAQAAMEMSKAHLNREVIDGKTYWQAASMRPMKHAALTAHLLPPFDEYTVAYRDRSAVLSSALAKRAGAAMAVLGPTIIVGGQAFGTWKRTFDKSGLVVTPSFSRPLRKAEIPAVRRAAGEYGNFLGQPVELA